MDNPLNGLCLEEIAEKSGIKIIIPEKFFGAISGQLKTIHYLNITEDSFESLGKIAKEIRVIVSSESGQSKPIINFSASLGKSQVKIPTFLPSLYLSESESIYDNIAAVLDTVREHYKPKLMEFNTIMVSRLELQNAVRDNGVLTGNYKVAREETPVEDFIDYVEHTVTKSPSLPGSIFKSLAEAISSLQCCKERSAKNLIEVSDLYKMIYMTIIKPFLIDGYFTGKNQAAVIELAPDDILYHDEEEINKYVFSNTGNVNKLYIASFDNESEVSLPFMSSLSHI